MRSSLGREAEQDKAGFARVEILPCNIRYIEFVTRTNWEGMAMSPDVAVPAKNALQRAHVLALRNRLEKTSDEQLRMTLARLIEQTEARIER
ncbi:MAG TPA: hypothetical protein VK993_00350 [Chthoniobacterales bacterium]|nr:hypothetical protein [Chthoniobacterales bacterium]